MRSDWEELFGDLAPGETKAVIRLAAALMGTAVAEAQVTAEAQGIFLQTVPEEYDGINYSLEMNRDANRINAWTRKGVISSIIRIGNTAIDRTAR